MHPSHELPDELVDLAYPKLLRVALALENDVNVAADDILSRKNVDLTKRFGVDSRDFGVVLEDRPRSSAPSVFFTSSSYTRLLAANRHAPLAKGASARVATPRTPTMRALADRT